MPHLADQPGKSSGSLPRLSGPDTSFPSISTHSLPSRDPERHPPIRSLLAEQVPLPPLPLPGHLP